MYQAELGKLHSIMHDIHKIQPTAPAGVKRLMLMLFNIHRSYENRLDEIINEAKKEFNGKVEVPEEGSTITI